MNPVLKTLDIPRAAYSNYLKKSLECLRAAGESIRRHDWNAAAICAVHSCIAACDSYCVYFLGKRHHGPDHSGAVLLFSSIKPADEKAKRSVNRLKSIIGIKNMADGLPLDDCDFLFHQVIEFINKAVDFLIGGIDLALND